MLRSLTNRLYKHIKNNLQVHYRKVKLYIKFNLHLHYKKAKLYIKNNVIVLYRKFKSHKKKYEILYSSEKSSILSRIIEMLKIIINIIIFVIIMDICIKKIIIYIYIQNIQNIPIEFFTCRLTASQIGNTIYTHHESSQPIMDDLARNNGHPITYTLPAAPAAPAPPAPPAAPAVTNPQPVTTGIANSNINNITSR